MNKKVCRLFIFVVIILVTSVHSGAQVANIDVKNVKQTIDGFGASTAWHGQISDALADVAFKNDTSTQIGLSIIRVRIDPSGSWGDEKANAQKAKARGALVLASPWTPPASMKTNSNVVGGELKTSSYADYAAYLKSFCDNMGNVDVISIQNEPNIIVNYESCTWSAAQIRNFCKNNAQDIGKPVIMPEAYNFEKKYADSTLNDSAAASHITYVGGHLYGTSPTNYTKAHDKGKGVWMTEHYYTPDDMTTCINMAREIVDCMYNNMSAYIWWNLRVPGCNIVNANGTIKKKGYTMAQFSKFIRPGYHRVDATYQPQTNVFVVAFKCAQTIVVAVNMKSSNVNQTFAFHHDSVMRVKKYTTSALKNLVCEGTINVTDSSFTTTLDASSITTFVSTVAAECTQALLTPYLKVNNGTLNDTNQITISAGDSVLLAPKASAGGSWSWNGSGVSGITDNLTLYPTASYPSIMATFTRTCGAQSIVQYSINLNPTNVITAKSNSGIMIYPNPATDYIQLSSVAGVANIQICNLVGQQVMSATYTKNARIDISGIPSGVYIITIRANGIETRCKLLKK